MNETEPIRHNPKGTWFSLALGIVFLFASVGIVLLTVPDIIAAGLSGNWSQHMGVTFQLSAALMLAIPLFALSVYLLRQAVRRLKSPNEYS